MILYGAHCPYCHLGEIGIDSDSLEIVFNPDRILPLSCEHLASFNGALSPGGRRANWLWVRGLRSLDDLVYRETDHSLCEYLLDIIFDELPASSLAPPQPYLITGGTAPERETRKPGSGEPLLSGCGSSPVRGTLDFWALYAPDARKVASALLDLLQRWDRLLRGPNEAPQ